MIAAKLAELERVWRTSGTRMTAWESSFVNNIRTAWRDSQDLGITFEYTAKQWNRMCDIIDRYK